MKWMLKLILTLVIMMLVIVICLYTLPQNKLLGSWFAKQASSLTGYQIEFSDVQHRFSTPNQLTINDFSLATQTGLPILKANKVIIELLDGYSFLSPSKISAIKTLYIQDGDFYIDNFAEFFPINVENLQLKGINLSHQNENVSIEMSGVSGRLTSFPAKIEQLIENDTEFDLFIKNIAISPLSTSKTLEVVHSADSKSGKENSLWSRLITAPQTFRNVIFKAQHLKNMWYINEFGADWQNGSITAKLQFGFEQRKNNHQLAIENLSFSNLKLTLPFDIEELKAWLTPNKTYIKHFAIYDSSIVGKDWSVDSIDLELRDVKFENESLIATKSETSGLFTQAQQLLINDILFPTLNIDVLFEQENWQIRQFSTQLLNGEIATNGFWDKSSNKLTLNALLLENFSFTLQTLPNTLRSLIAKLNLLDQLTINSFTIADLNLQDTSTDFPWQVRGMNINSQRLKLIENGKWGYLQGLMNGSADNLSINGIDFMNGLTFSTAATKDKWLIHDLKASTGIGFFHLPELTIYRNDNYRFDLKVSAQDITQKILPRWKWPKFVLTENNGELINLQLNLSGNIIPTAQETLENTNKSGLLNWLSRSLSDVSGSLLVSNTINYQQAFQPTFNLIQKLEHSAITDSQYEERPKDKQPPAPSVSNSAVANEQRDEMIAQAERLANMHNAISLFFDYYALILQTRINENLNQLRGSF